MIQARTAARITIVDEHALFAESLSLALGLRGYDCRLVAAPPNPEPSTTLVNDILRGAPSVVVLDLTAAIGIDGRGLIEPVVRGGPSVVVVTESMDPARWGEAVVRGARTVVSKHGSLNGLTSAIRRLHSQEPVMARDDYQALVRAYHESRAEGRDLRVRFARLTAREGEILGHLMGGRTVTDVARLNVVSEATVRTQVKSVLTKLGVSSQLAAVGLAHRADWLPPAPVPRTSAARISRSG